MERALLAQPHEQQVLLFGSCALTCLAWLLALPPWSVGAVLL